jgi:hypothetical protein
MNTNKRNDEFGTPLAWTIGIIAGIIFLAGG